MFHSFFQTLVSFRTVAFKTLACLLMGVTVYLDFIFDHLWCVVMQFLCMEIFKLLNEMEIAWTMNCMCEEITPAFICVSVAVCNFLVTVTSVLSFAA